MTYSIVPFTRTLSRDAFDCGYAQLNVWLREQAGQQERKDNTRTFLAHVQGQNTAAGYYSAVVGQINVDESEGLGRRAAQKYAVPAVVLARLSVDMAHQGNGLGKQLLVHALRGFVELSQYAGVQVLVVDAIDARAKAFYVHWGFTEFTDASHRLFLTSREVRATIDSI